MSAKQDRDAKANIDVAVAELNQRIADAAALGLEITIKPWKGDAFSHPGVDVFVSRPL